MGLASNLKFVDPWSRRSNKKIYHNTGEKNEKEIDPDIKMNSLPLY